MRLNFSFPIINLKRSLYIIFTVILLDQISKFYIKLNFPLTLYGDDAILDYGFFKLLFIENKGMAWGTKLSDFIPFLDDEISKLLLTIIRIVAIIFLGYWIKKSLEDKTSNSLLLSLCLIFAGAIGNLLDSIFYGVIFSHSYGQVSTFLPKESYAPFFFGHVVDMLQFPILSWVWPKWIPFVGGEPYTFFEYVFNIADSSISLGIAILIFFNRKFLTN
ncbi:MAG: lipoprotein signal peptidase [Flavobacteriaceae bacterium]|tara:strand:- start:874 stop:1527 length:654 start_codon:yes stop_codon:yes gene_type:complete